jgi:hypothetical protein
MARFCYIADYRSFDANGFIPCAVIENEAGMSPMLGNGPCAQPWYWGKTLEECEATCKHVNKEKLGLTEDEVLDIIGSSMRASLAAS